MSLITYFWTYIRVVQYNFAISVRYEIRTLELTQYSNGEIRI